MNSLIGNYIMIMVVLDLVNSISIPDTCKCYSKDKLISLKDDMYNAGKKLWIHPNVYNKIKQLNICAKKRGTRAGKRKHNITNSSQNKEDNNSFCVGLINVRSARNKTTELQEVINEHDFDAIAITETWLTKNDDIFARRCMSRRIHGTTCTQRRWHWGRCGTSV